MTSQWERDLDDLYDIFRNTYDARTLAEGDDNHDRIKRGVELYRKYPDHITFHPAYLYMLSASIDREMPQDYVNDLLVADRRWLETRPNDPFIFVLRDLGTELFSLAIPNDVQVVRVRIANLADRSEKMVIFIWSDGEFVRVQQPIENVIAYLADLQQVLEGNPAAIINQMKESRDEI